MKSASTCDNCLGAGKLTLYGPGFDKTGKYVFAQEIYQHCTDCDGSGHVFIEDEEE